MRAIWPTDPDAGGTWIAARQDGLVLALLNRNIPHNGHPPQTRSRGLLIPALITQPNPLAVMAALAIAHPVGVSPFRLLAIDSEGRTLLTTWDGLSLSEPEPLDAPLCLASSGLGDDKVMVRQPLFERTVAADPRPATQDDFHRHRWNDRPEVSVLVSREAARTVSITTVLVTRSRVPEMTVETLPEGAPWCDPVGAALLK